MRTRNLIAIAVVLVAAAVASGFFVDSKWREFDKRAKEALEFGEAEKAKADSAKTEAQERVAWADSVAAEARDRAPEIRERIRIIRQDSVPEGYDEFVAEYDAIIDELLVESATWRAAYDSVNSAYGSLLFAYDKLEVAYDSVSTVLKARPKPPSRWSPKLSVGVFAGVCHDGRLCAGVGPGITFEIKIPTPF